MEKKQTFVDNIGENRTEISSEIEFRKQRLEMFGEMSAADVAEAPFVYLDRQLVGWGDRPARVLESWDAVI